MHRLSCFLLLLLCGCAASPAIPGPLVQVGRAVGVLARPFPHKDVPSPPTLPGYLLAQALGQTRQIELLVGGRVTQTITDPAHIQAILAVVSAPDQEPPPGPVGSASTHLVFTVGAPAHRVELSYSANRNLVTIYNVPVAHRSDHMVAEYSVPATFGAALTSAIGQHTTP